MNDLWFTIQRWHCVKIITLFFCLFFFFSFGFSSFVYKLSIESEDIYIFMIELLEMFILEKWFLLFFFFYFSTEPDRSSIFIGQDILCCPPIGLYKELHSQNHRKWYGNVGSAVHISKSKFCPFSFIKCPRIFLSTRHI